MRIWLALAAAAFVVQALPVHAERDPNSGAPIAPSKKHKVPSPITDRFYVRGTFFSPAVSTILKVNSSANTTGTLVNGERDLGLDSRTPQGRIEVFFRLRERNKLRVDYFETNRSGNQVLSRQILFGDQVFDVGDRTTSNMDWRSFGLTYTYSFIRTDRFELGGGIAVHFLEADAMGAVQAKQLRQEVSGAGAFPTIPVDFTWRISQRFAFTARAQYLHVIDNSFDGAMGDYHGDFQYRWTPNFSLGAGYTRIRSSLTLNNTNFPGLFRLDVRGPEAFFKVSF